jgi:hypothetical protein
MQRIRRSLARLALVLPVFLAGSVGATQHALAKEDALKAAFVFRIASFVSWPAEALPSDGALRVVVVGDADLARHVDQAFAGQQIQGRTVQVTSLAGPDAATSAHVVFLSERLGRADAETFLRRVAGSPVLTMGDESGFAARGGVVELIRDGARLRFELNAGSARRAGLKLSSQVLRLASHVHGASVDG